MLVEKNICGCRMLHGIVGVELNRVTPLVSIIVPIYNAALTLEKCVSSLFAQTYKNIEIILVNNGSIDDSLELCRKLASLDNRILVLDLVEKGVSVARNKGVEIASGEYVTFVDADDCIDSNVCEIFAELNEKHHYDLFCYSAKYHKGKKVVDSFLFLENAEFFDENQKEELQIKVFAPQAPIFDYKTNTRFAGSAWGKFYKREILLNNNLRFATETIISEDVLFNTLSLGFFHKIGYTKQCFYHYEQSKGSAQNRYRPNSDKCFVFVVEKIQEWLQNTGKDQRFVEAANCLFVHYLFGILKEDLCHKDNPDDKNVPQSHLYSILSESVFVDVLRNVKWNYFSFTEKILVLMLKLKMTRTIAFAMKFVV